MIPDLVETVAMMLESKGCEVGMAYDGIEAEESIKKRRPDLIILDIMMPRKDGYVLCAELKIQPQDSGDTDHSVDGCGRGCAEHTVLPCGRNGHGSG